MSIINIIGRSENHQYRNVVTGITLLILTACDLRDKEPVYNLADKVIESEFSVRSQAVQNPDVLYFGFDLRASPQEDARQYLPFLNYLEESTGYSFRLFFTPKGKTTGELLGAGKLQFAAIGSSGFISAQKKYGIVPLVSGVNRQGIAEYQSVIIAARDSDIRTIKQLKGKNFAFGDFTSTQGHLIPRIILRKNGLTLADLKSYEYTGSHQNCANSVMSGVSDVCGMQDTMAKRLDGQGLIRIIHISDYYPSSGIAASRDVPDEIIEKVKAALLNFDPEGIHKQGLYHWDKTEMPKGFVKTNPGDHEKLKYWSEKLGFIGQ